MLIGLVQVYFDIEHGDKPLGRVVLGLYGKTVPQVRDAIERLTGGHANSGTDC